MALINLWKSQPAEYEKKLIQQIVAIAGNGALKDGGETSSELRVYLGAVSTLLLGRYLNECLEAGFPDSGLVLQDIVNELGVRLDCTVVRGLYRGKPSQIGFDGLWTFAFHSDGRIELSRKEGKTPIDISEFVIKQS